MSDRAIGECRHGNNFVSCPLCEMERFAPKPLPPRDRLASILRGIWEVRITDAEAESSDLPYHVGNYFPEISDADLRILAERLLARGVTAASPLGAGATPQETK